MTQGTHTAPLRFGGVAPGQARAGLVLVHGRGGSARDILGLGEALGLTDIAMAAPTANGNTWWPTSFLAPNAQMEPYVQAGFEAIASAIVALEDGGLPRDRITLAGFSQGGCLALEYAARNGGLASVFGLSAGLVGTSDSDEPATEALYGYGPKRFDYATDLTGLGAYISVHQQDPHIPIVRAEQSADALGQLGAKMKLSVAPGQGHGISQANVAALHAALRA